MSAVAFRIWSITSFSLTVCVCCVYCVQQFKHKLSLGFPVLKSGSYVQCMSPQLDLEFRGRHNDTLHCRSSVVDCTQQFSKSEADKSANEGSPDLRLCSGVICIFCPVLSCIASFTLHNLFQIWCFILNHIMSCKHWRCLISLTRWITSDAVSD